MGHTSRSEGERSDEENIGEVSSINETYRTCPRKPTHYHICTLARLHNTYSQVSPDTAFSAVSIVYVL